MGPKSSKIMIGIFLLPVLLGGIIAVMLPLVSREYLYILLGLLFVIIFLTTVIIRNKAKHKNN